MGERVLKELMALTPPRNDLSIEALESSLLTGSELREIAVKAGIPHSTHSRLLRKLIKLGLVESRKGFDGRVRFYIIKGKGMELAGYLGIDLIKEILKDCGYIELSDFLSKHGNDVKLPSEFMYDSEARKDYVVVSKRCVEKFGRMRKYPYIIAFLKSQDKQWWVHEIRVEGREYLMLPKPEKLRKVM